MKRLAFVKGSEASPTERKPTHSSGTFRSTEDRVHSWEYSAAIDRITSKMDCTDMRELLRLVPECFKGVLRVEIELGSDKVIAAYVEESKVVFTAPADDDRFVKTAVPLIIKHSGRVKQIGEMRIGSFYPLQLGKDNPNDKEETRKVLDILGSLVARTIDAKMDGLTALPVRKYFEHSLAEHVSYHLCEGRNFSLITIDIDHFKDINDTFGHSTGDTVLAGIARVLHNGVRARSECTDAVFRIGGEEFAILLLDVPREEAARIAERLRMSIREHDFGIGRPVTCSFGVADVKEVAPSISSGDDLFDLADDRLYRAKESGRDSVVTSPILMISGK
ncbi:MAG: GGDEF domain-containing protein [Candidatus Micrarchaeia archaeon]